MSGDGCVEGDGGMLDGKTGVQGGSLTVATLRDVRLFRCKRFEVCLFSDGREGTFTKKGLLFRLRSCCFGSLYRGKSKEQKNINQQRENRGKNIRFSMLKSYVI